jgi:hypothetical protein
VVVKKYLNIDTILLVHFLAEDQTLLEYFTHICHNINEFLFLQYYHSNIVLSFYLKIVKIFYQYVVTIYNFFISTILSQQYCTCALYK